MTDPFSGHDFTRAFQDVLRTFQPIQLPDFSKAFHRDLEIMRQAESALARFAEEQRATFRVVELFREGGEFHAILQQKRAFDESVRRLADLSAPWRASFDAIAKLQESIGASHTSLYRAIASAAKLSLGSELALERLHLRRLDSLNASMPEAFSQVRSTITDLSRAFTDHLQGFRAGADFFAVPQVVAQAPPRELFLGAYSLDVVAPVEWDEEDEGAPAGAAALAEIGDECASELLGSVPDILASLDQAFVQLWEGARDALESDNPDRIRHFATSFRDLFTHVLHRLAPTDSIRAWSKSKDDFDNDKPTRRARLRYVCRNVEGGHYRKFVALDIDAGLQLLQLFQQGTHELQSSLTASQLAVMRLRMEAMLIFLIDVARSFGGE